MRDLRVVMARRSAHRRKFTFPEDTATREVSVRRAPESEGRRARRVRGGPEVLNTGDPLKSQAADFERFGRFSRSVALRFGSPAPMFQGSGASFSETGRRA